MPDVYLNPYERIARKKHRPYRILAIDGGGIRGVIPAIVLQKLEKMLGGRLSDHFDLFAGTSTGSILAAALAIGMPVEEALKLYKEHGSRVFPGFFGRLLSRIARFPRQGVSAAKYSGRGLNEALRIVFGDRLLRDASKPLLIVTYDTFQRAPYVFKSWNGNNDCPIWVACRASCSAPTYFPAAAYETPQGRMSLVDGGVVANNPSACALAEAVALNGGKLDQGAIVASFGTGRSTKPITLSEAQSWGLAQWGPRIIDVLMDSSEAVHYQMLQILGERYFRFQMALAPQFDAMDNASADNIDALVSTALGYLSQDGNQKLLRLVRDMTE
ncbi:MAG: patatin-like phospholipase family protein [Planctomycetota bacterium]|nr:patatin-like phospholipase family protein [Planctomycetota bacterium]